MNRLALHIVSFDVPWPPNYGGVIDVFYKIRALHAAGVAIRLHCFDYGRGPARELESLCEKVYYYPRKSGISRHLTLLPYIVASRRSEELERNLLADDAPILFEGLHTCALLNNPGFKGRFLIYRESNIEHHYYQHLSRAEKNPLKKAFFLIESVRLKHFQRILRHASLMLAVSADDAGYLSRAFPGSQVEHLPSFHRDDTTDILAGRGTYALYHGKLSVPENLRAAEYLIRQVWNDGLPELIISGLNPPPQLIRQASGHSNIRVIPNPSEEEMFRLVREAHVNIMVTFQPTGLKLKLLNALFHGRFCVINPEMASGTSLGGLCTVEGTPDGLRQAVTRLFAEEFTPSMVRHREQLLQEGYSNRENCRRLLQFLAERS